MNTLNENKSYLSDKSIEEKKNFRHDSSDISDPLELFHKLHSKGINTKNPINTTESALPEPKIPEREPTFTEAEEHLLCDFYCSRLRPERLAMHRRTVYLRADRCWPWEVCELQAYREAWLTAGSPQGPFTMAIFKVSSTVNEANREPVDAVENEKRAAIITEGKLNL